MPLKRSFGGRPVAWSWAPGLGIVALGGSCTLVLGINGDYHEASSGGAASSASAADSTGSKASSGATGGAPAATSSSTSASSAGGGGAGSTSSQSTGAITTLDVIDDMEDDDGAISQVNGRQGNWFTFNDMSATGSQAPPSGAPFAMSAPGANGSLHAARTQGSGFTLWGTGFGADLDNDGVTRAVYDASAWKGITFWAKAGVGADSNGRNIRFNFKDVNTDPSGGICDASPTPDPTLACQDGFGADITLTTAWTQYTFAWEDMTQQDWGLQVPSGIAKEALYQIVFGNNANAVFDTWVDDLAFYQ